MTKRAWAMVWVVAIGACQATTPPPEHVTREPPVPRGTPVTRVTRVTIDDVERGGFGAPRETTYTIEPTATGYVVDGRAIEARTIDDLYAAQTALAPSNENQSCVGHTDDFPTLRIIVEGDQPFELMSTSSCYYRAPWNVIRNGERFVQAGTEIGRAVAALMIAVEPKR